MKKLSSPQVDNMALWDGIVSHKHAPAKAKLLSIRDKIQERYAFYEDHFNSLDEVQPLLQAEWSDVKAELISCYGENVEFKKARRIIFACMSMSNQTKCPYCMLSRSNTLDHYFDKDEYPEFSVYVPNLVPCCSECNTDKNTSVFDSQNNRKYIHFYHDLFPAEQFLFVRFSFSEEAIPLVRVYLQFDEEGYYSRIIRNHFAGLSLISKYQDAILDRLAPLLEEIRMNRQAGMSMEIIVSALQNRKRSLSDCYGNNYWETCIYEGILNSPGFLSQFLSA